MLISRNEKEKKPRNIFMVRIHEILYVFIFERAAEINIYILSGLAGASRRAEAATTTEMQRRHWTRESNKKKTHREFTNNANER